MKVYNEKKEFVGYVSSENGIMTMSGQDITEGQNTGLKLLTEREHVLRVFQDLFLWFIIADVITLLGFSSYTFAGWSSDTSPFFFLLMNDNYILTSPFAFLLKAVAALVACFTVKRMAFVLYIFLLQGVIAASLTPSVKLSTPLYGMNWLSAEMFLIFLVPFVIHLFYNSECLCDNPSYIRKAFPNLYKTNILCMCLLMFLAVLYLVVGVITGETFPEPDETVYVRQINNLLDRSGNRYLSVSFLMFRILEIYQFGMAGFYLKKMRKKQDFS